MDLWLYDPHQKYSYPRSWEKIYELLRNMDVTKLARDLQKAIEMKKAATED